MKKFAAAFFTATVLFAGVTALAADETQDVYFGSDNSVHFTDDNSDISNYTTVLIRKSGTTGADGVVYVDQQSSGFKGVMDFMLKADAEKDNYIATFGNSKNETKTVNFTIGDITPTHGETTVTLDQANKMSVIDEATSTEGENYTREPNNGGSYYKKGFTFIGSLVQFNSFERVYLVSADGKEWVGAFDLYDTTGDYVKPEYSGSGDVAFGIQIYNLPEESKGINLYLGTKGGTK